MVVYEDFINMAVMMRMVNAGHSNLSDKQAEIVDKSYQDAFVLLVTSAKKNDSISFGRVCWAVRYLVPGERAKQTMKNPDMYEKMLNSRAQFKAKVEEMRKRNEQFDTYWKQNKQYAK